ncbi:type II secretion system protein N [Sphingomonas montana]|uniref:type II secretion system protein N n=1 Tax=Sphingomonas montana TaxID=1843236 RepID=UPI00096F7396|nr:type II secretion system protein N [Sphingomonas montana]
MTLVAAALPVRVARSRAAIGVDLFTCAVIVSVAVALAGLTWRLSGESGLPAPAVAFVPPAPPPPIDVAAIVAASPFGSSAPLAATAVAGNLTLRAIMFARPASASTALVSAGDAPSTLLHIGDPAPGGAIVDSIAVDHVLLRGPAGLQTLGFPKPGAPPAPAGTAPAAQPFVGLPTPTAPAPVPSAPLVFSPPPSGLGAPSAFLDSMGATATDGGYRIGTGASPAMRSAGLQPGDLVERVNGVAVGDASRDRALFASAAAGGPLRVELVRNGRRIAVSLPAR